MTTRQLRNRVRKGGMAFQDEAPPEMDYAMDEDEDEDDLSDLLDEEPAEDEGFPPEEDEMGDEDELQLAAEVDNLYKQLDGRDDMILQLAKATRTLAKRVMALEGGPESDFSVGGDDDLGEPEAYQDGEENEPGLTAGEPQGIAQNKALRIAKRLAKANVPMRVIAKSTGFVYKDDKWSNFGEKDADVPANAPVTPDTKDWADDFSVVPGSGQAPADIKGIGSVAKALGVAPSAVAKALTDAGIVKKSAARTPGNPQTQGQGGGQSVDDLEQKARDMSFRDLNQLRIASGDL